MVSFALIAAVLLIHWRRYNGAKPLTLRSLGWTRIPVGRALAIGLAAFLTSGAAVLAGLLVATGSVTAALDVLWRGLVEPSLSDRLVFLGIGVAASAGEETLWRGYLQPRLVRRIGPIAGLVAIAALFALAHLDFRAGSLVSKLGIGLSLGMAAHLGRSLFPAALAHTLVWSVLGTI